MEISSTSIAILIGSYLLGAVPFGLVLTRLAGLGDIREIGSGNIGATNVLRTGRKDLALATLLLDAGKGAIAVLITTHLLGMRDLAAAAGLAAFVGHCFPVYLKFKGGKGVATFFGTLFAVSPLVGLIAALTWGLMALVFRMSSLAGLSSAVAAPIASYYLSGGIDWMFIAGMTLMIFIRHHENIGRILSGTESKIGKKAKETE